MAKAPKAPRKFSDIFSKYKTYDTSTGFGSVQEWSAQWESMTGEQAQQVISSQGQTPLGILGFTTLPTLSELKTRYRQLIRVNHPDHGGDTEIARTIIAAYTVLLEQIL